MPTFYHWQINSESLLISVIFYEWLICDSVIRVSKLCMISIFSDQFLETLIYKF